MYRLMSCVLFVCTLRGGWMVLRVVEVNWMVGARGTRDPGNGGRNSGRVPGIRSE